MESNKEPLIQTSTIGTHQGKHEGQEERWGDEQSTEDEWEGRPQVPEFVTPGRTNGQVHDLTNREAVESAIFDIQMSRDLMTTCHCTLL
jgi:hypothetical protein